MNITKVEAWSFDGKTYPTEGQALRAAVAKLVANEAVAQTVIDNSPALIPLLQRIVEIGPEHAVKPVASRIQASARAKLEECPGLTANNRHDPPQRGSQEYAAQASPHSSDGIGG